MPNTDITYCASDCQLTECSRHESQLQTDGPDGWVPGWVSMADLSEDCPDYTPPLDAA